MYQNIDNYFLNNLDELNDEFDVYEKQQKKLWKKTASVFNEYERENGIMIEEI